MTLVELLRRYRLFDWMFPWLMGLRVHDVFVDRLILLIILASILITQGLAFCHPLTILVALVTSQLKPI